jgi:hypothetical protein
MESSPGNKREKFGIILVRYGKKSMKMESIA